MKTYYLIMVNGYPMQTTEDKIDKIYEFKNYQEALDMVDMCYGRHSLLKDVQIVPNFRRDDLDELINGE